MTELTIASLNIFGMSLNPFSAVLRYKTIADYFNNSKIDVIHFQEVFSYFHLCTLKKALKNYPFCIYKSAFIGPKGGLVIFSKYPLENTNYISFSNKCMPYLAIPELIFQKGVLLTELKKIGITLVNTHFTAVTDHIWNARGKYYKKMLSEIATLQNFIQKKNQSKITIASGDFNIEKGSNLYNHLVAIKKIYDPFKESKRGTRHQEFMSNHRKPNCIDYIFIFGTKNRYDVRRKKFIFSGKVKLLNEKLGYVSDHIGLQITIKPA